MHKIYTIFFILLTTSFCSISNSIDYASRSASSITKGVTSTISNVAKSVTNTVKSISGSVSSSSGSDDKAFFYNKDIKSITALYYQNKKIETLEFKSQIRHIANQNGILNWQENYITFYSIGQGLKTAGASEDYLKDTFLKSLNKNTYNTLKEGFYSL